MTTTTNWFSVDKEGLAKLLERKGKEFVLYELIQNCLDTDAKNVTASLTQANDLRGYAEIEVLDDHPEGWKDLTHAWTLYAESEKKSDAQKRGRFNLGEKLVLALCKVARIETTTGGVMFDDEGRHTLRGKREAGSRFYAKIRMTAEERQQACEAVRHLLPPEGVKLVFNDVIIQSRTPLRRIEATLPTEIADAEGILRRSARKTVVEVYEAREGEVPSVYEMGIPVVETNDRYHYNILQKVPLNSDRDNVTPAYLRELRTLVLNEMHKEIKPEEATEPWVRDAASDGKVSREAVESVMTLRYGEKRVIADPSDQEGTKLAMSKGYEVIPPRSFSSAEWVNIRKFQAALPAGQVTPSPKPFGPEGELLQYLSEEKWTAGMKGVVSYVKEIAQELLGCEIAVRIASKVTWPYAATYSPGQLTFNLGRLGHAWFDEGPGEKVDELLIHEAGHHYSGDHLSESYHDALCSLGARLAFLALRKPEMFRKHGRSG
jgi:hypothetical protein